MQVIHKLAPSKSWLLAQNKVTGHFFTGHCPTVYCGKPTQQQARIDKAKDAYALDGTVTPDGSVALGGVYDSATRSYIYPPYTGPGLHDVVLFDHIPVVRLTGKFKRIYHGNSDIGLILECPAGFEMMLRGSSTNRFFELVGKGKILMDNDGFYQFDVMFSKHGEKVYMELYGY